MWDECPWEMRKRHRVSSLSTLVCVCVFWGRGVRNEPLTVFELGREVSAGLDHAGSLTLTFPLQNREKINVHGLTCPVVTFYYWSQAD